jgi:uncharacterized protein (TIGR02172 family)
MTIQFFNNEGEATLMLCGRLDTAVSSQVSADINQLLATAGTIQHLTVDAGQLEYISSSGLRILLMLAKRFKDFSIKDVNPEVYDVLSMTGFTKMMTVERALRQLSIEGCEMIGVGGVGTVYRLDDDTIIKVFREGTTMDEVRKEITMSKEAFVMGMPTAISFDVVRVGDQYGLVYELLHAHTLSACLKQAPERMDELARKYADLFRQMHQIQVPADSSVPDALAHERSQVLHIRRYFPQESIDLLLQILDAVPSGRSLLHLDLQAKNVMLQGEELMLIDMGEMGYGHPVLDLAHAYSALVLFVGDYDKTIGIPRELGNELWNRAINYYFEGLPDDVVALRKEQIKAVACIRNFSWLALSDSFPEDVINECKALFDERVTCHREQLLQVCQTLKDWV